MLHYEILYKLILEGKWKDITQVLYKHKLDIASDNLLKTAANVFEDEFVRRVSDYPLGDEQILEVLDTLYLLHHGRLYQLKPESYKRIIIEISKRKPLADAIPFARIFPDEEECKKIIAEFEKGVDLPNKLINTQGINSEWRSAYNPLFDLINRHQDTATYFSGPRFIKVVKEFEPYFPDYSDYISIRESQGKSTSRKIFYYDILSELKSGVRLSVIKRILQIVEPFEKEKTTVIYDLISQKSDAKPAIDNVVDKENPTVFISYSWDNEMHKTWVLTLAKKLAEEGGVNVILDRFYLRPGKSLTHFVENSISKSDRILMIFTPNYKLKADGRTGGVGYEYSIMNAELYKKQTQNEKIIPVLRAGTMDQSIPTFMQQYIHIDMRNDENFNNSYNDILREIHNQPEIARPIIGKKPDFSKG